MSAGAADLTTALHVFFTAMIALFVIMNIWI
jgi:hypothetical protein